MRNSRLYLVLGTAAITMSVFLFTASCKKNKNNATTEDTGYASDHALAEKNFDDAESVADVAAHASSGSSIYRTTATTAGPCAMVTKAGSTITVDFGTVNCTCTDGRTRRGKIIINHTGSYFDSGSVRTITFDNYYQNDNRIEGTKTVTHMGLNSAGKPYYNITLAGGKITRSTGATIESSWARTRTWTNGSGTPFLWSDDEYSITGGGSITRTSAAGVVTTGTVAITSPLIVKAGCRWIEAGTVSYTFAGGTRTLNYGTTATCDDQAVLTTAAGTTTTITLP
ncbi:MAG: hypothetical protein V4649_10810 [Bacteroidota bacterium]